MQEHNSKFENAVKLYTLLTVIAARSVR